jgi:hypothetical protein
VKCYKCGGIRPRFANCKSTTMTYFKCEKSRSFEFKSKDLVCYNCGESGHISTMPSKSKTVRSDGRCLL